MKHIDPSKLAVADVVVCTRQAPVDTVIRARTWKGKSWFGMGLGTHCGVIVDRGGGLFYVAEMLPRPGLEFSELEKYDNAPGSWRNHIVCVKRHPLFGSDDGGPARRNMANEWMIRMHSFGVKYGFDEILKFVDPDKKVSPYRMICSVWAEAVWGYCSVPMPFADEMPVSPADWQRWTTSVFTVPGVPT